jgi:hypothetical protein
MPKWAMHSGMLGASKKAELLSLNSDLIVFCTQTNAYENTLVLLSGAFTDFAESARVSEGDLVNTLKGRCSRRAIRSAHRKPIGT